MSSRDTRYAALRAIAEFDHVFTVHPDGTLTDGPDGIYAPDVFHDEADDITVDGVAMAEARTAGMWDALTGYTGQHGYSGAVMHASEYIGGQLAADILEAPGVYVVTAVEVHPEPPYPHRVDDTDGSCPECGADDAREGNCPSHPDYPDTAGMSWGELADLQNMTAEQEPAGWAVLRLRHVEYVRETIHHGDYRNTRTETLPTLDTANVGAMLARSPYAGSNPAQPATVARIAGELATYGRSSLGWADYVVTPDGA